MKQLVETKDNVSLLDPTTGTFIPENRPSVVVPSVFTQERLALDLKILAQLSDDATDAEWVTYLQESDGDVALAQEAFLSTFAYVDESEPEPEPEPEEDEGDDQDNDEDKPAAPKRRGRPPKNVEA